MHKSDHRVPVLGGAVFARRWEPADARGAAIVLIHDSLGCVALWRDFPRLLAEATGRVVVAYDRLGFGLSDPHPGPLPPDFITQEAAVVLPALAGPLDIGAWVALGHSVGGAMAVEAGGRWPEQCRAVVTIASQAFVEDRTLAGIREAKALFADPAQMERLARHHGDKAGFVLDAWTETWLDPAFAGWTQDAALARLQVPLLAMHGDRDEYGSLRHPERLAARAGGPARALVLEGCGHVPHREQPERVIAAVMAFLAEFNAD